MGGASGGAANQGVALCDNQCGRYITSNYNRCQKKPPAGMTKGQWQEHFGPIVSMCKSFQKDRSLSRCARMSTEATETLTKVCCTKATQCKANHGAPTKCTGRCLTCSYPSLRPVARSCLTVSQTTLSWEDSTRPAPRRAKANLTIPSFAMPTTETHLSWRSSFETTAASGCSMYWLTTRARKCLR